MGEVFLYQRKEGTVYSPNSNEIGSLIPNRQLYPYLLRLGLKIPALNSFTKLSLLNNLDTYILKFYFFLRKSF